MQEKVRCVVTTPNAFMQKLMPPSLFREASLTLEIGQFYERDWIHLQLRQMGYVQVDVVEDRGECAIHSNIIDIFPLEREMPLRLVWKGTD